MPTFTLTRQGNVCLLNIQISQETFDRLGIASDGDVCVTERDGSIEIHITPSPLSDDGMSDCRMLTDSDWDNVPPLEWYLEGYTPETDRDEIEYWANIKPVGREIW